MHPTEGVDDYIVFLQIDHGGWTEIETQHNLMNDKI